MGSQCHPIHRVIDMQLTISTSRLTIRPFVLTDAEDVARLAGDYRVSETATAIPHPYPLSAAIDWISNHCATFASKKEAVFAITDKAMGELLGAVSLMSMSDHHARCELGYWVAHDHWSKGICSEAARAIVEHAHRELGMTRVIAYCLARNVGSARVMEKAGLTREKQLPKHVNHKGVFEDVLLYGINFPARNWP
jgi:RimJ/RimL family protein N-acetyltransferase